MSILKNIKKNFWDDPPWAFSQEKKDFHGGFGVWARVMGFIGNEMSHFGVLWFLVIIVWLILKFVLGLFDLSFLNFQWTWVGAVILWLMALWKVYFLDR